MRRCRRPIFAPIIRESDWRPRPIRVVGHRLRQPEIKHLDDAFGRECDIGGLQIAVDDAFLVRRIERIGDLSCRRQHLAYRQRPGRYTFGQRRPSTSSRISP